MKITHPDGGVAVYTPTTVDKGTPRESLIHIETEDSDFTLQADENLLDALIRTGHDIDYQCRSGYCGSCRTKKISGDVVYDDYPLAHLNDDEILPCYCRATSSLKLAVARRHSDDDRQGELFD